MISYAVAWLATVALLLFARRLRHPKKLNLPPGPKPWPIIGNLNLIGSLPHRSVHELSKTYGEIMSLKFGSKTVVIGSSVDMAKVFLTTMDANFACRPKMAAGKYTTYNYSDITWAPYGPYWRQVRKISIVELFSHKQMDSFQYIRVEEVKWLLKAVHRQLGKEMVLKNLLSTVSLNVISRMVLGKRYLDEPAAGKGVMTSEEFIKRLDELSYLNGVLNIGDWIPWLGFMDLQGYVKKMKAVNKKFDRFLELVLNDHEARRKMEGQNFVPRDVIDTLLQIVDNPTVDFKLERHGVKGFIQDMLAGGTESSPILVEWAIAELLKKPELFKKATDELDQVIGQDRWVEENDMSNLPYIRAIAKETMRLHPVAPLLTPRRTQEDCKVAGYDIPKDTLVFVNIWTTGRDQHLWDKPEEFIPERFLEEDIDSKGENFKFLPFGAGRRMCPGYNLGVKVVESTLANLLHGFVWKLPDKMTKEDLNMEEAFALTTSKKEKLILVAHPRLPLEMYSL